MSAGEHRFKPERTNGGAYFCDCSCGWSGGVARDRWAAQVLHDVHAHGLPGPTDHLKVKPILLLGERLEGAPMSDTPCACGCAQDAATIERLRERLAKVEALADESDYHWFVVDGPDGEYVQEGSPCVSVDDLRAALAPQNPPQDAASAPEAPGQGEGAGNAADGDSDPEWEVATDARP